MISVRCKEWRNGVNIGEVIRDLQYEALNCNFDLPPVLDSVKSHYDIKFEHIRKTGKF